MSLPSTPVHIMPSAPAQQLFEDPCGTSSIHTMLREATRAQHEILDATLSRFDLKEASSYRCFLLAHRQALVVLIECCSSDDRREFTPLLNLLDDDLGSAPGPRAHGLDLPRRNVATEAGVAYVLRGSRLGAKFLRRRVGPSLPASYLHHELPTPWITFLARLESIVPHTAPASTVIDAARMAFGVFVQTAAATPITD